MDDNTTPAHPRLNPAVVEQITTFIADTAHDPNAPKAEQVNRIATNVAAITRDITILTDRLTDINKSTAYAADTPDEQAALWAALLDLQTAFGNLFNVGRRSVEHAVNKNTQISDGTRTFKRVGPPRFGTPTQIDEVTGRAGTTR
jgi:hypothetical protein